MLTLRSNPVESWLGSDLAAVLMTKSSRAFPFTAVIEYASFYCRNFWASLPTGHISWNKVESLELEVTISPPQLSVALLYTPALFLIPIRVPFDRLASQATSTWDQWRYRGPLCSYYNDRPKLRALMQACEHIFGGCWRCVAAWRDEGWAMSLLCLWPNLGSW